MLICPIINVSSYYQIKTINVCGDSDDDVRDLRVVEV